MEDSHADVRACTSSEAGPDGGMEQTEDGVAMDAAADRSRSLLALLAIAQGWHERAVMLRFLGFEVSTLFSGKNAKYKIKSLGGGGVPVSESQIASLSAELLDAAELAKQQVEALLGIMAQTIPSAPVPALSGRAVVVATATPIAVPDLDESVVVRCEPEPIADRNPYSYVGRAPRGTSRAPASQQRRV
jgi:hypothetical protein